MMPYKSVFIKMFSFLLKKPLTQQFGKELTKSSLKKAPAIYKSLLEKTEDIGADNPMASNTYMCYVFFAIWKAADGKMDPDGMKKVSLKFMESKFAKKMFGKRNMNIPEDYAKGREKMEKAKAWADAHPEYKDKTWDINFDDNKHKDGYFYYFTRCPIEKFARENGFMEILPVCCDLDHLLTKANHGVLHRDYTLSRDGSMCDYWVVPDQITNPQ
ncbi:MAG: L-2-amino-thiazoline-4-carboxylic acid hydrolase [Treponema sp.]|nr:L-2-amino-thiazoline-4-carboxylic acid hydrolase [Treponema sp.]